MALTCLLVGAALGSWFSQGTMNPQDKPTRFPDTETFVFNDRKLGITGVSVSWKFQFENAGEKVAPVLACTLECQGKKHAKHDACNLSCDKECQGPKYQNSDHGKSIHPDVVELGAKGNDSAARSHSATLNRAFDTFGCANLSNADSMLSSPEHLWDPTLLTDKGRNFVVTSDHWNKTPCTSSVRGLKARDFIVTGTYKLIYEEKQADGTMKKEEGPSGEMRWKWTIYVKGPLEDMGTSITCRCEVAQEPPKDHGFLQGWTPGDGEYAYCETGGVKTPLTGQQIGAAILGIICHDMVKATITCSDNPPGNIFIPAGWELECIMGNGQDVQLCQDLRILPADAGKSLQVNLAPIGASPQTLRLLCLNILKPEPDESMKYRLVPPSRPALARLARITRETRFRGPWDQVRLWLATDFATYDKMAKVMIPMTGEGTYVREMYKAASVEAISPQDKRVQALMEPRFMFAENQDLPALDWFVTNRMDNDKIGTLKALRSSASAIRAMFDKGDPMDDAAVLGTIAEALVEEGGTEGVEAMAWMMESAVPEQRRAEVLAGPHMSEIADKLLMANDDGAAEKLIEWIRVAKPSVNAYALLNPNPRLSQAVQDKSRALGEELSVPRKAPKALLSHSSFHRRS